MFKKVAEAYDTLSDPGKRREYDDLRNGGSAFGFQSASRSNFSRPSNRNGFSNERAFDLFNHFFADFDDFHDQMFGDVFNRHNNSFGNGGTQRNNNRRSMFEDPFGSSMMMSGFGGGFGHNFGGAGFGNNSGFSMSSSTYSSGSGTSGRSTSTSTFIGSDGRKTVRTETTIFHPDGTKETSIDERVEEPENSQRIGYSNGSSRLNGGALERINSRDQTRGNMRSTYK